MQTVIGEKHQMKEKCKCPYCKSHNVKTYSEYIMAKVKLDVPEPTKRRIQKGEPILPPISDNEILNEIDKIWQDLGTKDFKDVSKAMPLIAQRVGKECKRELYSKPKTKLFHLYKEYLERMVKDDA